MTVANDIVESGVKNFTPEEPFGLPEPKPVIGMDGKTYLPRPSNVDLDTGEILSTPWIMFRLDSIYN